MTSIQTGQISAQSINLPKSGRKEVNNNMAKDGTHRGGKRTGAGRKPKPLAEKLQEGKAATALSLPELEARRYRPSGNFSLRNSAWERCTALKSTSKCCNGFQIEDAPS